MTSLSELYVPLRLVLGDTDAEQVYQYSDDTLASALRTVFRMGLGPDGYALAGGTGSGDATGITPDLPDGDTFALVICEAGLLLVGGEEGAMSYKTRALSVTRKGDRKEYLLYDLKQRIYAMRDGTVFGTYQSLLVWLNSVAGIGELTEVQVDAPLATVGISGDGISRSVNL